MFAAGQSSSIPLPLRQSVVRQSRAGVRCEKARSPGPPPARAGRVPPSPARGKRYDSVRVMTWRASVLTILPEMFPGPLGASLCGKALTAGLWSLQIVDIRDFATDKHRSVDDTPAGGGPGMVMKPDVLARAIDATATDARHAADAGAGRGAPPRAGCDPGVWAFRRHRRAGDLRPRPRGSVDRRLCALRGRDRGHDLNRRLRAAIARRHGRTAFCRR